MPDTPDPADPSAPVPTVAAPSALEGYRPYQDETRSSWPSLNRVVAERRNSGARTHEAAAGMPSRSAGAHAGHGQHDAADEEPAQ